MFSEDSEMLSICVRSDDFGAVLNCAVRYSLGRQTYMPKLVVDFIIPLIPNLSDKTLGVFVRDIQSAKESCSLGDPQIDVPIWVEFLASVQAEIKLRTEQSL